MIKEITANARISFKQVTRSGDVFYTFEYGETRTVESDIEQERKELWDTVNDEINKQVVEVKTLYQNK
jgi:hypothetical protein